MSAIYNVGKGYSLPQLAAAGLKAMLVDASYTFNPDHAFLSSITGELSGTGYVSGFAGSGRQLLTAKVAAVDHAGDRFYLDCADLTWLAINAGTARAAVIYIPGSSDADSIPIAYVDVNKVTNGSDLVVQVSNSPLGLLEVV